MLELLSGQSICLAKITTQDAEPLYQAIKNSYDDIVPWVSWLHPNYQLSDAQAFVEQQIESWQVQQEYVFTINDHNGVFLGLINLHVFDAGNGVANIGYWMNSQFTGCGYCTKAVNLLVEKAFLQMNLIRIELITGLNNIASQKVAIKCGAIFEGILKNRIRPNGIATDAHLYAFTKS